MVLDKLLPFGGLIEKVFDRVFPNPEEKAKAQLEVFEMQQRGELAIYDALSKGDVAQSAVNQAEATHSSLFVAGWRPAVGWVCAAGLFAQYLGAPLLTWVAANTLGWSAPARMDMSDLMVLLLGMLGLGAYRTIEKVNSTR